jgi:DNA-directed RNA polymerase subunit alpha
MLIVQRPAFEETELSGVRSKFVMEPLEPGLGHTLGNTVRRSLLSRVPGAAITAVQIEGVAHEFTTIAGVVEDVVDIILNLKAVVVRLEGTGPERLPLRATGAGTVSAGAFEAPAGLSVVNPTAHIATLSKKGKLEIEAWVHAGVGYRSAEDNKSKTSGVVGVIPIDSIFSPVRRVSYSVENTQVGQMTNYERLILDVETDGSMRPAQAVSSVGKTLGELVNLFAGVGEGMGLQLGEFSVPETDTDDLHLPIEALELSERPRNCLRRSGIATVGDLVKCTAAQLLDITNFGQRSLEEVQERLDEMGLSLSDQEITNAAPA